MPAPPFRRTKIVATLGPATASREAIERLLAAGCDVFRLNFSHGTREGHAEQTRVIRELERAHPWPIAILQDLQGPKLRITRFATPGGVVLRDGQAFSLTRDTSPGDDVRVGLGFPALIDETRAGDRIRLRDGLVELRVTAVTHDGIAGVVSTGGLLTDNAGINVPDTDLSLPALTEKDVADLDFGATLGVDWVALSFVRSAADLLEARARLKAAGSRARLMAKIEKPAAVTRFEEILAESDGVMVARGDLGVEMAPEAVPPIQKRIIRTCVEAGKPVVTATQMLQSMIESPTPTRAEASDVANAIYDGTDAVMLSGETAVGRFAAESVAMMDRIAAEVEASAEFSSVLYRIHPYAAVPVPDALCDAAVRLARILPAAVIVAYTTSGSTALRISRHRPESRIVALTPSRDASRQLALAWGIAPIHTPEPPHTDALAEDALRRVADAGLARPGDRVLLVSGVPFGVAGSTNTIRVEIAR